MSDDAAHSILQLEPDPDNPREISDEAFEGLKYSVGEFGDLSGVVYNRRLGILIAGHQRVRALREAGATTWRLAGDVGEIIHPGTGERFPVRCVDWDETKSRMANLAANSPEISGSYTELALEQLKALEQEVGFESLRLGELEAVVAAELAALEPPPAPADFDDVDETGETDFRCPRCAFAWNGEPRP